MCCTILTWMGVQWEAEMRGGACVVKWEELYHGDNIIVCQGRKRHPDIQTP